MTAKVHYFLPIPRNKKFVGRSSTLAKLKNMFLSDDGQVVAIAGLGGVGKTQIALHMAHWAKETLTTHSVFWVQASNGAVFEQACSDIVKEADFPKSEDDEDPRKTFQKHLSSGKAGRWFIVVDNADDADVIYGETEEDDGISQYFPRSDLGHMLLTTRSAEIATRVSDADVMNLDVMDLEDAMSLWKSGSVASDAPNDDVAKELLRNLDYLPLAIKQATAYINAKKMPATTYLEVLNKTEHDMVELLREGFVSSNQAQRKSQTAVLTTWLISFKQIQKSNRDAANLLYFISHIEPKGIPESLLPGFDPTGHTADFSSAVGTLCAYSFLTKRGDSQVFDMHSLVHLATRNWIKKEGNENETIEKATLHLTQIFPDADYLNRAVWREYLPHALKVLDDAANSSERPRFDLHYQVGLWLMEDGRFKDAIKNFKQTYEWSKQYLSETHELRLETELNLATSILKNGQTKDAVVLLQGVVDIRKISFAEDHPDLLASQYALARALLEDGQIKEAVKILQKVVDIEVKILAEDHPHWLASQHVLAEALLEDGQTKEAVKILQKVVDIEAKILAEDHPDRLSSQHVLAEALLEDGQTKEAVKILQKVVDIRVKSLAEDHPNRLTSQHALARALLKDGQIKEAVKILQKVVDIRVKSLTEDHPDRLASQHALARALLEDGQIKEAVKILQKVVDIEVKILAEDHPHRLASQHVLAEALLEDAQIKEAVKILQKVVDIRVKSLAEDHPNRLTSQHALARALLKDGQIKEAVKILQKVVDIRVKSLTEDHPDRLASQHALAKALLEDGQIKEAVKILQKVVDIKLKILAEDHPSRLTSQHELARALLEDGQIKEAVKILQKVVDIDEKSLAEDHPDRLVSQQLLVKALSEISKLALFSKSESYSIYRPDPSHSPSRIIFTISRLKVRSCLL